MIDTIAPALTGLELPEFIDLTAGPTIIAPQATATDNQSDGSDIEIVVYFDRAFSYSFSVASPTYQSLPFFLLDADGAQNWLVGDATSPGIAQVTFVRVTDASGNEATYTNAALEALGFDTEMAVLGFAPDTTAPVLTSLDLPELIDLSAGPAVFSPQATAADDRSDASDIEIVLYFDRAFSHSFSANNPTFHSYPFFLMDPDAGSDWLASEANPAGILNVTGVRVSDEAGNEIVYTIAELEALGFDTEIEVQGPAVPANQPYATISNANLEIAEGASLDLQLTFYNLTDADISYSFQTAATGTAGSEDFEAVTGSGTFVWASETPATVTETIRLTALGDLIPDDQETFHLDITLDGATFADGRVRNSFEINILDPLAQWAFAETGTLQLSHGIKTVTLLRDYDNPVVVAFVATENGVAPVNVRLRNVSGNELRLQLQEPDHLDGTHSNETVNYLVVEAGTWMLPDGTLLEAGTLTSGLLSPQGFESVAFDAAFDATPVILSQVQSYGGGDFVTTRQKAADADGFQITMQEQETSQSGGHAIETLGWVAIEAGAGSAGGLSWFAGSSGGISHTPSTIDFSANLPGATQAIAGISSYVGAEPAWARGDGGAPGSFVVSTEEDTSKDAEISHVPEIVDYFVFENVGALPAAPLQAVLETGTLQLSHGIKTVTLQHDYDNPVVVAFVVSENGASPVNVRIRSIDGDQMRLQLQEPDHLDGTHSNETVSYVVVEAGTWILPGGTILEAGTLTSSTLSPQGFESVAFTAAFEDTPTILSQVQSYGGGDFVTTRQKLADASGFQITMQEQEASQSGGHAIETIGWLAIEAGSGSTGGFTWLAGRGTGVTDANTTVSLGVSLTGNANVVAGISSYAGGDTAWARGNGATANTFDVSVEEDTSRDPETIHGAETIDYFVFNEPALVQAYEYGIFG